MFIGLNYKISGATKQQMVKFLQINTNFWINIGYPLQNIPLNAKKITTSNKSLDFYHINHFNSIAYKVETA